LNLERSSARAERISGDLSIEGRANDVTLSDVKGAVRLNGEFMESVKLSKIGKAVSFKSSRTDMEFSRLDGGLDLDSGDLHANSVIGPVRLVTRSKDIRLDDVSGDVHLEDENGSIELRVNSLGNVKVQNRKGDIEITLPAKAAFSLDARSREGEVNSDFSELKVDNGDHQAIATGTVGGGGPHLQVANEHGNIEIRKGSAVATTPPVPPPSSPKPPKSLPKAKPEEPTDN